MSVWLFYDIYVSFATVRMGLWVLDFVMGYLLMGGSTPVTNVVLGLQEVCLTWTPETVRSIEWTLRDIHAM